MDTPEPRPRLTRRLFVQGRVQGVGFRWQLSTEAEKLALDGWVRNCRDGRVEALVSGSPEAVERLTRWARQGPPHAHVERLDYRDEADAEEDGLAGSGFKPHPSF